VRDKLLGLAKTGSIDIATEATPQQVQRALKNFRVLPTGLKHGTVTVHRGHDDIEITTFRREGKYTDYRRPDTVHYIRDTKADSGRRDFTINALYFDPLNGELLDYHQGVRDLAARKLRFIGSPKKRIAEDPLRLMRAVRFAATLDFRLGPDVRSAVARACKLIKKISAERIKQELDRIMGSPARHEGIALLLKCGLLEEIAPPIAKLDRTPHSKNYHSEGNVFVHTLLALQKLEPEADLRTAYGLLLHDVGKGATYKRTKKEGRFHVSFWGHQGKGETITRKLLEALRFSHSEIDEICWYVREHHVPHAIAKMRAAKQMRWALDPRFPNLLKIYRADSLASIPTNHRGKQGTPSLASYYKALDVLLRAHAQPQLQKALIDGHTIMRVLGIKPGPRVGRVLDRMRDLQLAGKIKNKHEALERLRKIKS